MAGDNNSYALWQDIAEVYRREYRGFSNGALQVSISTMTLKLYDGRTLKITGHGFENFEIMALEVEKAHQGWMAAVKRAELAEEGEAAFGPVAIRRDGLTLRGSFYPWSDVGYYEIENGHINFFRNNAMKVSFALDTIPNSMALFIILEDLVQVIRGRAKKTVL